MFDFPAGFIEEIKVNNMRAGDITANRMREFVDDDPGSKEKAIDSEVQVWG